MGGRIFATCVPSKTTILVGLIEKTGYRPSVDDDCLPSLVVIINK